MGKLKVFECFAGVGSQRMALRNLGIEHEVVGISEIDKFALKSYEAIHEDCPNFGDISKINPNDLPNIDLFTYSFPCQDLSVAGKQKGLGEETRSGLLYECEKIIETKKPKYLLLENVKNLVGKKFKNEFDKWLEYLEGLGYTNYWEVLNAKEYGVPQNRERVFAVSILNDNRGFEFPKTIQLNKAIKDILEDSVEEKYYINKDWHFTRKDEQKHNEGEIAKIDEIKYAATRSISDVNKICRCLDTMGGGQREPKILIPQVAYQDYYKVRKLTPLECWRLMSFTDEDFYKAKNAGISNSQLYKQAGNSIVVKVLEGIFENMFLKENKPILDTIEVQREEDNNIQIKWCI